MFASGLSRYASLLAFAAVAPSLPTVGCRGQAGDTRQPAPVTEANPPGATGKQASMPGEQASSPADGQTGSAGLEMTEVTGEAGLAWARSFGDDHLSSILEDTGSGVAWLDFDSDGWQDLLLLSGTHIPGATALMPDQEKPLEGQTTLWRNRGDGTFDNVTAKAGLTFSAYAVGVAVADYDLDGDEDFYLCNYGPNLLFRNRGDGTFEDATAGAGLAGPEKMGGFVKWSVSAAWLDVEKDGDLDLFVGNYLAFDPSYRSYYLPEGMPGPQSYLGQEPLLYLNDGAGVFREAGSEAGIRLPGSKTMGVGIADFDNDGDLDAHVANDTTADFLLLNDGQGRFSDVGTVSGVGYTQAGETSASMHASWGDVNHDGWLDAFVPDLTFGALFVSDGKGRFVDQTLRSGIAAAHGQYSGWGAALADLDNDGHLDLFVANGKFHHEFPEQNLLMLGDGTGKFADVTDRAGEHFQKKRVSRGAAFADWDNDGDMDAAVNCNEVAAAPVLLRNDLGVKRHWLEVKVLTRTGSPEAIGSRVTVEAGGLRQMQEVQRVRSYLSSSDVRVHFGLGDAATVDRLTVTWLSGERLEMTGIAADQVLSVKEGTR
jgi:hypothetical protein